MKPDQTNDSRYRAAELGALLARHYPDAAPHMIARVVFDMQREAMKAKRHAIYCANGALSDAQEVRGDKRENKAMADINAALRELQSEDEKDRIAHLMQLDTPGPVDLGPADNEQAQDDLFAERARLIANVAHVTLGGDPRGPCARLHIPGQRGDGWGEGFAIY